MVKDLKSPVPNLQYLMKSISTCEKRNKVMERIEKEYAIIERNLKLMRLPMSLGELDQEEKALVEQRVNAPLLKSILLNTREIPREKLYSLMTKLELYNVLCEKNLELLKIKLN